jgi:hypothetical protein
METSQSGVNKMIRFAFAIIVCIGFLVTGVTVREGRLKMTATPSYGSLSLKEDVTYIQKAAAFAAFAAILQWEVEDYYFFKVARSQKTSDGDQLILVTTVLSDGKWHK